MKRNNDVTDITVIEPTSSTDLEVSKPRRARKALRTVAVLSTVFGGATVLLRKYLNRIDESGWTAHEPSVAYIPETEEDIEDIATEAAPTVEQ
ncbi:MAG: hypothetical protein ACRDAX_03775 [Propionibacteriaceae bacterium]